MADIILEMKNITKEFPGVKALDNVNLVVERGEIHALIGENGAGKTTLMNVLSGIYPYGTYSGEIYYNGKLCQFKTLKESEALNIVIIHQELALIPLLSIGENMFLGNEFKNKAGYIDWNRTYAEAEKHMKQVGLQESPHTLIKDIGTGKQQLVEIAKAFSKNVKLLILDEPTSSLNDEDARMLLDLLMEFKKQGLTSIIITHKLNEIIYCADKATILRDGTTIETLVKGVDDFSEDRIIKGMVGRPMDDRFPARTHRVEDEVSLEVRDWTVHHPLYPEKVVVNKACFKVHKGEVVGFSGLQGAGRTELAMSIFGRSYGGSQDQRAAAQREHPLQHDPLPAGQGVRSRHRRPGQGEDRRRAHEGRDGHEDALRRAEGGQSLRRQPAKGAAGEVDVYRARHPDPGRTHPGHRRRREV